LGSTISSPQSSRFLVEQKMKVKDETREQLINELRLLRQRVTQLEALETERKRGNGDNQCQEE